MSTLAMNPKVVLRKEYKGSRGGCNIEMTSNALTLPLQRACAARVGVHIPELADNPFPVPVGSMQRGTFIASFQSFRANKPCCRAPAHYSHVNAGVMILCRDWSAFVTVQNRAGMHISCEAKVHEQNATAAYPFKYSLWALFNLCSMGVLNMC